VTSSLQSPGIPTGRVIKATDDARGGLADRDRPGTNVGDRRVRYDYPAQAVTRTGSARAVGSGIGDGLIYSGSFASRFLRISSDDHLINGALPVSV